MNNINDVSVIYEDYISLVMGDSIVEPISSSAYGNLNALLAHQDLLIQRQRELEYKLEIQSECIFCCTGSLRDTDPIYRDLRAVKYDLIALEKQIATLKGS